MRKNRMRLTESQLHNVIKESVKRVINEWYRADSDYPDNRPKDVRTICNQFKEWSHNFRGRELEDAMSDLYYNGNVNELQVYAQMFADEYGYSFDEVWKPIKWCANNMFEY